MSSCCYLVTLDRKIEQVTEIWLFPVKLTSREVEEFPSQGSFAAHKEVLWLSRRGLCNQQIGSICDPFHNTISNCMTRLDRIGAAIVTAADIRASGREMGTTNHSGHLVRRRFAHIPAGRPGECSFCLDSRLRGHDRFSRSLRDSGAALQCRPAHAPVVARLIL